MKSKRLIRGTLKASAACMAVLIAQTGHAQDRRATPEGVAPQDATADDAASQADQGLADIVVTARRVAENSQRAPVAIDVVQPEQLVQQNVIRAEDLGRVSPSLAVSSIGGPLTAFFVRGVGNTTANAYTDPAIAFNYDGAYIARPSSTSGFFYDLQRVEVLKGPQGTLYGRNATAGAINVIPNRPRLGQSSGELNLGYGNYDWLTGQAALNLPMGDAVAMRAAGMISRRDGFTTDGTGKQREYAGRLQIYAEPSDSFNARLGIDVSHQGGSTPSGFYVGAVDPVFGPTGFSGYAFTPTDFSPSQGLLDPRSNSFLAQRFIAQAGRAGAQADGAPYNDNDFWGVTAEVNYITDAGTLTIQPAYRESSLRYAFNGGFRIGATDEKNDQTSIEARWAGSVGSSVNYLLGAMYFDESATSISQFNQYILTPYQSFSTGTKSYAGYGSLTVRPFERLSLTAAGRYTSDKKQFDGNSNVYILFCGNPAPPQDFCPDLPFMPLVGTEAELVSFYQSQGVPVTPVPLFALPPQAGGSQTAPFVLLSPIAIDSRLKNSKFTYRFAAQYDLSSSSMIYASFETGYRAGGFSFARGLDTFEPETIKAYTIGTKSRFLANRLQVNLELFRWKYRNQQFTQFGYDLGTPPATVFLTRNIGDGTIKGADLDVDFLPTPNTLLTANVQYLKTEYDSFVYFLPNTGLPPNTGCPASPITQTGGGGSTISVFQVDCSGRPALNAPKWSFTLNAQQTVPLGGPKLILQLGTRYRSSSYVTADYLPYLQTKESFVSNASVTLSPESDRWFASVYVFNIENNRPLIRGSTNSAGLVTGFAEQPRTYGIRLGAKF